jgi:CubicO group peptidase (beta-lactamase class C family)
MNLAAAAAYAERHELHALHVVQGDDVALERYANGYDAEKPHALYSGTKSFWGVLALAAQEDGLLDLEEPVGATFAAWSEGPKAAVTLRMLLQLTAGIGFGGLGSAVPNYERALAVELKDAPGSTFTYGGIPLQVFGAVLARKLAPRALTPHAYLRERILDPAGVRVGMWRTLKDGTQPLPTGAFLTARAWSSFGRFVRDRRSGELARCFVGSTANPRYGLCWWLSPLPAEPEIVYASGSGGQALYMLPAQNAVVVKFGGSASYRHDVFLKRLLDG